MLYPVVGWVQRHLTWFRRSWATLLVFLVVLILIAGLVTLFAIPLAREGASFIQQFPDLLEEAKAGRGVVGKLINRTNALHYLQENQDRIRAFATGLTAPAARVLQAVATGVAGVITIFILAFLMVLEGPKLVDGALNIVDSPRRRQRIRKVGADCAKSITGYISGNLVISVICGVLTYAVLKIMGIPFAGLIALFVAIADLIPLIGATLGAIVAVPRPRFIPFQRSLWSPSSLWLINSWRTMYCNHSSCPEQSNSIRLQCLSRSWWGLNLPGYSAPS